MNFGQHLSSPLASVCLSSSVSLAHSLRLCAVISGFGTDSIISVVAIPLALHINFSSLSFVEFHENLENLNLRKREIQKKRMNKLREKKAEGSRNEGNNSVRSAMVSKLATINSWRDQPPIAHQRDQRAKMRRKKKTKIVWRNKFRAPSNTILLLPSFALCTSIDFLFFFFCIHSIVIMRWHSIFGKYEIHFCVHQRGNEATSERIAQSAQPETEMRRLPIKSCIAFRPSIDVRNYFANEKCVAQCAHAMPCRAAPIHSFPFNLIFLGNSSCSQRARDEHNFCFSIF